MCGEEDRKRLLEIYRTETERDDETVKEVTDIFDKCQASNQLLIESEKLLKLGLDILSQIDGDAKVMSELVNLTHQLIIREK